MNTTTTGIIASYLLAACMLPTTSCKSKSGDFTVTPSGEQSAANTPLNKPEKLDYGEVPEDAALVLEKYLESKPSGRIEAICRSPQIKLADLKHFYGDNLEDKLELESVKLLQQNSDVDIQVEAHWLSGENRKRGDGKFWLEKKSYGWCVHWLSFPRLRDSLTAAYIEKKPTSGYFTVSLDDYYTYQFTKKEDIYYSLDVHVPNASAEDGYLRRDESGAPDIYERIKTGAAIIRATAVPTKEEGEFLIEDAELVTYED